MTFDDDFCQFEHDGGMWRTKVKGLGLEWPPPPIIKDETESIPGIQTWVRQSLSGLSDNDRAGMSHVARGALYHPSTVDKA